MFEGLFGFIAVIALFIITARQNKRLQAVEHELRTLRKAALGDDAAIATATRRPVEAGGTIASEEKTAAAIESVVPPASASSERDDEKQEAEVVAGPWAAAARSGESVSGEASPDKAEAPTRKPAGKPDIETALGTRWAVWVGGLALALGGLFLVRYTIEAGIFGPGVRLAMAAIFGLALAGGGEFVRRTGFRIPVQGAAGAYIPAILTAAGAFVLFGTVYAAHGIYGFIGPAAAFFLLGAIGVATVAAALVHGQALAGLGLLGSLLTPVLVSSQSPNAWALFGYLAIVLTASVAVARVRDWRFLSAAAFVGTGVWTILYMVNVPEPASTVVLFINVVALVVLALLWLGGRGGTTYAAGFDLVSLAPAFFTAFSALALFVAPVFGAGGAALSGAVLVVALLAAALARPRARPLLHAAGAATVLAYLTLIPFGALSLDLADNYLSVDALPAIVSAATMRKIAIPLGLIFIAAGFWVARRQAASAPIRAACWAAWGVAAPLVILLALWSGFGNLDRDLLHAAVALLLLLVFAAGAEWIALAEEPPRHGGPAVSFALAGAGLAAVLFLHMAFGSGLTTVLLGASAVVPALATRWRSYPVLGWLSAGAAAAVLARVAFDPTIVGADALQRTPVFNWLLPGYGTPAVAFGFSAWQLARTTGGRPRLVMEAAAALFGLLAVAMLVRHAMHGGVIDTGALTLAEQAIYTLIALGAGAILVALDMRSPSSVLRYGSLGIGVVSVLGIVGQHFLALNPLFTDESTGRIPVFNLLFLGYLLPAIAAGALALYARGKRPKWYSAMLALVAALLAFVYATLSVRRLFKGEFIGLWSGMEQVETYSYSALWLVMGVALLVGGVSLRSQVLRIASAALIAIAVLKVFLFDMSELEGVLRALSFIGLGAVLIGIGLFYQRLLTRAAATGAARE